MADKILLKHLEYNRQSLLKYSELVSLATHKVDLGTARESLIANFLEQNLPQFIKYHSGEIFDKFDESSGQIDIVLHPITAPKLHLFGAINLFPSETVLAALEVKTMLDNGKVKESLESCFKVKSLFLKRDRQDNFGFIDSKYIPFIVFAFTANSQKTVLSNIENWYNTKNASTQSIYFSHLPDLIIVLETRARKKKTAYYLVRATGQYQAGKTIKTIFKVGKNANPLYGLFEFLTMLTQVWASSPKYTTMPVEDYTKDQSSLFSLF